MSDALARSLETYTDPGMYAPFTVERGRTVGFCIDPRPVIGFDTWNDMPVAVQSPAGGVGDIDDARLVARAQGQQAPAHEIAGYEIGRRTTHVLGTHGLIDSCAYQDNQVGVLAEIAKPGDLTRDLTRRLERRFVQWGDLSRPLAEVGLAASGLLESGTAKTYGFPGVIERAYPNIDNVPGVQGNKPAEIYVINAHDHVGQNRNRVHEEADPPVTAFHDSIAKSLLDLGGFVPRGELAHRAAARILRTAATIAVLASTKENGLAIVEVTPGRDGVSARHTMTAAA